MFQLNPTNPPPTTIIIDNFDKAWANGNDRHSRALVKQLRDIVTMLADQSVMGKRFNLMLVISSPECARTVLQWDQMRIQIIETVGIWERQHVEALFYVTTHPHGDSEDREHRLVHCTTAGTPGFVVWSANRKSLKQIEHMAKEMEKEWTHGLHVLDDFLLQP